MQKYAVVAAVMLLTLGMMPYSPPHAHNPHTQLDDFPPANEIRTEFTETGMLNLIENSFENFGEYILVAMHDFTYQPFADVIMKRNRSNEPFLMYLLIGAETEGQDANHQVEVEICNQLDRIRDVQVRFLLGMNHKFGVFSNEDHDLVLTGSADWTKEALERQDNHIVSIPDADVVDEFTREFWDLWNDSNVLIGCDEFDLE